MYILTERNVVIIEGIYVVDKIIVYEYFLHT